MAASFEGKRGLIMGVANKRSIAWAIAQQLADGGASLAFTYQGERIEKSVRELADSVQSRASRGGFHGQPEQARRIESMHGRPAVRSIADEG